MVNFESENEIKFNNLEVRYIDIIYLLVVTVLLALHCLTSSTIPFVINTQVCSEENSVFCIY